MSPRHSDLLLRAPSTAPRKFAPDVPLIERVLWRCQVDSNGCWLYTGSPDSAGYGMIRKLGANTRCHQVTYSALVGEVPDGKMLDHLCRVHPCCNPAHLESVTNLENSYVRAQWPSGLSRAAFCSYGHAWTEENTYDRPDGNGRQCRTCIRRRSQR